MAARGCKVLFHIPCTLIATAIDTIRWIVRVDGQAMMREGEAPSMSCDA